MRPLLVALLAAALLPARTIAAPPDTIGQRVLACTACHGAEGRAAPDGYYPRIAGKPAAYLYNQLRAFRDGRRHSAAMEPMVARLTDAYLREIAEHFAALELPYALPAHNQRPPRGEQLVRNGDAVRDLPACAACHGRALTGTLPATPGLLGLPRDYLAAQIGAWQTGQRHAAAPDCMAQIARKLTPEDVGAIALWLSSLPVPQPAHAMAADPGATAPLECGSR